MKPLMDARTWMANNLIGKEVQDKDSRYAGVVVETMLDIENQLRCLVKHDKSVQWYPVVLLNVIDED